MWNVHFLAKLLTKNIGIFISAQNIYFEYSLETTLRVALNRCPQIFFFFFFFFFLNVYAPAIFPVRT